MTTTPLRSRSSGVQLHPNLGKVLDLVGLVLATAVAAWAGLVAGRGAEPGAVHRMPAVALILAVVTAATLGRFLGARRPLLVPGATAVGVAAVLVAALPVLPEPAGRPLGYANANATLASLGALAALGAALLTGQGPAAGRPVDRACRAGWLLLAVVLAGLVLVPTSVAAALSLVAAGGLAGVAIGARRPRLAVSGGALLVAVALGGTVMIAIGADPAGVGTRSEARGELWRGAAELARDRPWRGNGPGSFAELNPVTDDPDLRWAHHGYLQGAAELGLPGFALGLALLGWSYVRLWVGPGQVVVGAAVVTTLALHATVDYLLHFPPLPLITALLLGWATAGTVRTGARRALGPARWETGPARSARPGDVPE